MDSTVYSKFLISSQEYNRLKQIEKKYLELNQTHQKHDEKDKPSNSVAQTGSDQTGYGANQGIGFLKLYHSKYLTL